MAEKTSFLRACQNFFGPLPGQSALQFGKEIQALTNDDRKEIAAGLVVNGYNIDPATIERKAA